jgi:hypothetical protein
MADDIHQVVHAIGAGPGTTTGQGVWTRNRSRIPVSPPVISHEAP